MRTHQIQDIHVLLVVTPMDAGRVAAVNVAVVDVDATETPVSLGVSVDALARCAGTTGVPARTAIKPLVVALRL